MIVEFPKYAGPAWLSEHICPSSSDDNLGNDVDVRKLVPIGVATFRCDCGKGCSRTGIPLTISKAVTIHGSQGLTVGPKEAVKRVCVHIGSDRIHPEVRWPGSFYVACTRPKSVEAFSLNTPYTSSDANKVGTSKGWKLAQAEMDRIKAAADTEGTEDARNAFKAALNWFIDAISSRYGGDGVFARKNDASTVLECMQQWRDSCALL